MPGMLHPMVHPGYTTLCTCIPGTTLGILPKRLDYSRCFCPFLSLLVCSLSAGSLLFLPKIRDPEVRTIPEGENVAKSTETSRKCGLGLILLRVGERFPLFSVLFSCFDLRFLSFKPVFIGSVRTVALLRCLF